MQVAVDISRSAREIDRAINEFVAALEPHLQEILPLERQFDMER
jgi:hypothetical protein